MGPQIMASMRTEHSVSRFTIIWNHCRSNDIMNTTLKLSILAVLMLLPRITWAQYSSDVFDLKKAQDQYDERGFMQGAALSVDGKLAISNQNGTPSYSYPVSAFTSGGHQVVTTLNYCGSVQFTAFKDYDLAGRVSGSIYSGWSRFHQNRPAWILGVNGWAVNMISTASHFHSRPDSRIFDTEWDLFSDVDVLWLADGYDFCNRMRDFGAVAQAENYNDIIRLLRADGSVMELMNVHTKTEIDNRNPDTIAALYTGYYFVNEANPRGYGIVRYDSSQFTGFAWSHMEAGVMAHERAPLHPRVLHYFPGDGTEVIFKEHLAPFGTSAYKDFEGRSGGLWGHPTIFYLEEIRSNGGTVAEFTRARHHAREGVTATGNTTRGRALITSFTGHTISVGDRSMVIEALGRTTKVKFDVVSRSGTALTNETMPYARLGGATDHALAMADYPEYDLRLYKSFLGYVTEIIDPEDRSTKFTYDSYVKRYQNTGFPHAGSSVTLALSNHRLKTITEPDAQFTLGYYGTNDVTILPTEVNPKNLNNVVDSVRKYTLGGVPLTTDFYTFSETNLNNQSLSGQIITDHVTGHQKQISFLYENYTLSNYEPILTPGRHTVLKGTVEWAGNISSGIVETSTTTSYQTGAFMPGWGALGNFTVLPTSQVTTINGIPRSHQEFSYELDTLRGFWKSPSLSAMYGMEVTRKVTRTMKPDEPAKLLLVDTTVYLHLPMPDSMLNASRVRWNKFKTIENFFRLRDTLHHPDVVGRTWEEVMFRSPVAVFDHDSTAALHAYIPPIFGLEERAWVTDTNGAVTGKRNIYMTDVVRNGDPAPRGVLIADSVLGSNGERILKGEYEYRREWSGHLLASVRNAFGITTTYSYAQAHCPDTPYWEECSLGIPSATGTIIANDGTSRPYELAWSPFAYWFFQASQRAKHRTPHQCQRRCASRHADNLCRAHPLRPGGRNGRCQRLSLPL